MEKQSKNTVWKVLAVSLLTVLGFTVVYTVVLSMKRYSVRSGLIGSPWSGIMYYLKLTGMNIFPILMKNSLLLKLCEIIVCAVFALLPVKLISRFGKSSKILTSSSLALIPVVLPDIVIFMLLEKILPMTIRTDPDYGLLYFLLTDGIPWIALYVFAGGLFAYLNRKGIGEGAKQGVLICTLVLLISSLSSEFGSAYLIRNSMNTSGTDTLNSYAYRVGFMDSNFGTAAAAETVRIILQTALAIAPAVCLERIARPDTTRIGIPKAEIVSSRVFKAVLFWTAAIVATFGLLFGLRNILEQPRYSITFVLDNLFADESIWLSTVNSLIYSAAGGLFAAVIVCAFMVFTQSVKKGFGALTMLFLIPTQLYITQYLLLRQAGVFNTWIPQAVTAFESPQLLCVTVILCVVLRLAPERKADMLFLTMFFLAAALVWGDYVKPMLYLSNRSAFPVALILRQGLLGIFGSSGEVTEEMVLQMQTAKGLAAVLTMAPALLLGTGAAISCFHAFKE